MPVNYNNLPPSSEGQSQNKFINAVDAYSETPIELDSATFDAVTGFFTSKNFNKMAAQSVAVILMSQCKRDNLNPMQVLDTMQGVTSADLSLVLTEILNFNRYNSSFIGYSSNNSLQNEEIFRNIIDNDKIIPYYAVSPQQSTITEGNLAVFVITVKDIRTGTILYWDLNSSNTVPSDLIPGQPTSGQIQVINDGINLIRSYPVTIATIIDSDITEIEKIINFNLRVDSPTAAPVAQNLIKLIPLTPIIRLVPRPSIYVDPGQPFPNATTPANQRYPWELYETNDFALRRLMYVDTRYVPIGTTLFWTLDGVNVDGADFVTPISGSFVVTSYTDPANYRFSLSIPIAAKRDFVAEGDEPLSFNLRTQSLTGPIIADSNLVIIDDLTFTLNADYITIEYTFTDGQDLDTRTRIAGIPGYVGWGQQVNIDNIIEWGGDNTSITGSESALINVAEFKKQYPGATNLTVDCRAQWYGTAGTTPIVLLVTAYTGGTMILDSTKFKWTNPTATSIIEVGKGRVSVSTVSQTATSLGTRVGVLKYDLTTFVGYVNFDDTTIYP
jgi:hypothetical protein